MATWIYREDESGQGPPTVYIPIILDPDRHWYLNLSRLLEVSFLGRTAEAGSVGSMRDTYRDVARKLGVTGVRGHAGGWVMFGAPGTPQDWAPRQTSE
jgi:hypothetical protein